jgi:hypothetical protein
MFIGSHSLPPLSGSPYRSFKGAGEKVVGKEVHRAVAEDDAGLGHHATQWVPDHPCLSRQLSGGET